MASSGGLELPEVERVWRDSVGASPTENWSEIAGLVVRVVGPCPPLALPAARRKPDHPDLTLRVWSSPQYPCPQLPTGGRGEVPDACPELCVVRGGPGDPVTWSERATGNALVWLPPQLTLHEQAHPFRTALYLGLRRRGLQMVHAGALARQGKAILVVGRGGVGKSTLCQQATDFTPIGDDFVLLEGTRTHPLYTHLKLRNPDRLQAIAPLYESFPLAGVAVLGRSLSEFVASTLFLLPWSDAQDLLRIRRALSGLPQKIMAPDPESLRRFAEELGLP